MTIAATWWGEDVIPRIRWRITVPSGETIPDGYGIAYYDADYDRAVCMPLPLNAVVSAYRAALHWLKCPPGRTVDARHRRARAAAWDEGARAALSPWWITNPYRQQGDC